MLVAAITPPVPKRMKSAIIKKLGFLCKPFVTCFTLLNLDLIWANGYLLPSWGKGIVEC
jgi:hypothetical protein